MEAMAGQVDQLPLDELVELACRYPLKDGLPNDSDLEDFFPEREAGYEVALLPQVGSRDSFQLAIIDAVQALDGQ